MIFGLACVFAVFAFTYRAFGFDLEIYLRAAEAVVAGRSPYLPAGAPACWVIGCFLYPPPTALLFTPLLLLPHELAIVVVVAALGGVAAAMAAFLIAPLPRAVRPWAAAATVTFFPLLLEVNVANLNLVTAALALLAWSWRDKPARGGIALSAALGLKLLAGALVLFYVAAHRWRPLAWAAAIAAAVVVVTWPIVGAYWPASANVIFHRVADLDAGFRPTATPGPLGQAATIFIAVAVAVFAGIGARRSPASANDLHALALAAAPLVADAVDYTFLVLALPLLAALSRTVARTPPLLALPLAAWLAMESADLSARYIGLFAALGLGIVLFLPRALRGQS